MNTLVFTQKYTIRSDVIMKNTIIPEKELNKLTKVLEEVGELVEIHSSVLPNFDGDMTDIEKIHTIMYIDFLGDFIKNARQLKDLLEIPEEKFVSIVTEDGKYTVEDMLLKVMGKTLLDMLER